MIVTMMMVSRNSQHAPRAADNAASHPTDNAADRCANRTGCTAAHRCASLATSNNALSMYGEMHRKNGKNPSGYDQSDFHEPTPCFKEETDRLFAATAMSPP